MGGLASSRRERRRAPDSRRTFDSSGDAKGGGRATPPGGIRSARARPDFHEGSAHSPDSPRPCASGALGCVSPAVGRELLSDLSPREPAFELPSSLSLVGALRVTFRGGPFFPGTPVSASP
eukprot:5567421-Pyramimonas_sp.AAC.1